MFPSMTRYRFEVTMNKTKQFYHDHRHDTLYNLTDYFGGKTYNPALDKARLSSQLLDVFNLMRDGEWRSLQEISERLGAPETSVSARLRDIRKDRFAPSFTTESRRASGGFWLYRVVKDD